MCVLGIKQASPGREESAPHPMNNHTLLSSFPSITHWAGSNLLYQKHQAKQNVEIHYQSITGQYHIFNEYKTKNRSTVGKTISLKFRIWMGICK